MGGKIYLNLLLLCGILSQGIIGNLANENIKEPSDILIRQKRVINRTPGKDKTVSINNAPFVVNIKKHMRIKCVGAILSYHVVITIATCTAFNEPSTYNVVSGSSQSNYGNNHNVTEIRKKIGNHHPSRPQDGVALLIVAQAFDFRKSSTNFISLHSGPLLPGIIGTVYGWGYNFRAADKGTSLPRGLRSIEVPILSHNDCVERYRPYNIVISDKDVCTFHQERYCGHTDEGAPLVIDGYLAGLHLRTGIDSQAVCNRDPGIFVILQHSEYKSWITSNIRNIEEYFGNYHH